MHAARRLTPRLSAVLDVLADRGQAGATTRELLIETGSVAIHSDVAELRTLGHQVTCTDEGRNAAGRRVFRYRLEERPPVEPS